jgi:hypothetical protein
MATRKAASISLDDFVRISTQSALVALREENLLGKGKVPFKIWVGIIVDPWEGSRVYGAGGELRGGGAG